MASWQRIAERTERRIDELGEKIESLILRNFDLRAQLKKTKEELEESKKRNRMYEKKVFKLRKIIGETL